MKSGPRILSFTLQKISIPVPTPTPRRVVGNSKGEGVSKAQMFNGKKEPNHEFLAEELKGEGRELKPENVL